MTQRTESEWRELYRRLNLIATDIEEEQDRRVRAQAIIETIPREYRGRLRLASLIDDLDIGEHDGRIV